MAKRTIAILVAVAILLPRAYAGEFGNVLGPGEEASRQASARALEGLERTLAAFRMRELRKSAGWEEIGEAAQALRDADKLMSSVDLPRSGRKIEIAMLSQADRSVILAAVARNGKSLPTDVSDLYQLFRADTRRFAETLAKDAETKQEGRLPNILDDLSFYIRLADVVARLGRQLI
jgi:hypothetical protein